MDKRNMSMVVSQRPQRVHDLAYLILSMVMRCNGSTTSIDSRRSRASVVK